MSSVARHRLLSWLALYGTLALTSCTGVVETAPLVMEHGALGYAPTCHSTLGAYYLPRALLRITAQSNGTTLSGSVEPAQTFVADPAQTFCLDYLALPNSHDVVTVQREVNGLLTSISSNVVDKTPDIAKSLIAIGENIALQAGRSGGVAGANETLDVEFDPFVWNELMAANRGLRRFGFCLYVEGHSFPTLGLSPAQLVAAGQQWCDTSNPAFYRPRRDELAALPVPVEVMKTGVVYRPNLPHKIVVMRKSDPGGPGKWSIFQTKRVDMPNVSPVLSIGIDRAAFATRKTTLNFTKGVLTDVAIDKTSELAGFVGIPLAAAKAIVDVPAQIVTLRITDTNNQTALLNAQSGMLQALATYQQTVGSAPPRSARLAGPDARSGRFIGGCIDAGADPDACNNAARNATR